MKKRFYLSAPIDEFQLARDVRDDVARLGGDMPSSELLVQLTREKGIDWATTVLRQAILDSPRGGPFIRAIQEETVEVNPSPVRDLSVLLMPAMFHEDYPEVGGGGDHMIAAARAQGFQIEKFGAPSKEGVVANAKRLAEWIRSQKTDRIGLVTLSKGSLEYRYAYHELLTESERRRLVFWLNFGGTLDGNILATERWSTWSVKMRSQVILWITGLSKEALVECGHSFPAWNKPFELDPKLLMLHYFAMPLSSHVQTSLIRRFEHLRKYGPNDGFAACRSAFLSQGYLYPVWGADHFCRTPEVVPTLYRTFSFLRRKISSANEWESLLKGQSARTGATV